MKILVTGAAGFIGFHLCNSLLRDDYEILGVDNLNTYYDQGLKLKRLEKLKSFKNFSFKQNNIADRSGLSKVFDDFRPVKVVNLAAQAGVRYSITNPFEYLESNLHGFLNVIELCRNFRVAGLIYASSSSVYGENQKIPFSTDDRTDLPISLYGATKKANELIAHSYSKLYDLNTTALRFFTVYGPWGRPDMALYIFTDKILNGETIDIYNFGNMKRDFTYIDDIIMGTRAAIDKNYSCEIFNLGNNKTEKLMKMVDIIEEYLGKKALINFSPIQPGDVPSSFADIDKSYKLLNFVPKVDIQKGIPLFIDWFLNYHSKEIN